MRYDVNKYSYKTFWYESDKMYVGACLEFPSLSGMGNTPEKALKEIKAVVEESIEEMEVFGEEVPEPFGLRSYKGRLLLRLPPEVHRQLAMEAAEAGVSLNQYILSKVA